MLSSSWRFAMVATYPDHALLERDDRCGIRRPSDQRGIMLFNFSGFVLGPVITSLLFAVWKMYIDHYQHDIA